MDKIYHVFVSSTYADLANERQKVSEAIAKSGFVAEGMEIFPASSQKQFDFIKRIISRCDYYVVIVGGRYGTLADSSISYTEHEYEFARELGLPTLAFLHRNPETIPLSKVEKNAKNAAKLKAFRNKLTSAGLVDFWETADELATKVVVSLAQESTVNPGVGWVRGDQAIDAKFINDLEMARSKVLELEEILKSSRTEEDSFPPDIEDIDAEVVISTKYEIFIYDDHFNKIPIKNRSIQKKTTWKTAFLICTVAMRKNDDETKIVEFAVKNLIAPEIEDREKGTYIDLDFNNLATRLRYQFEALGLIIASIAIREEKTLGLNFLESSRNSNDTKIPYSAWALTEKGRRFAARQFAVKRKNREVNLVADT